MPRNGESSWQSKRSASSSSTIVTWNPIRDVRREKEQQERDAERLARRARDGEGLIKREIKVIQCPDRPWIIYWSSLDHLLIIL